VTTTLSQPTISTETLTRIGTSTSQPTTGVKITTTLYVGKTAKSDATATYQWYRVDGSGTATAIDGATSSSYTPTSADVGYKIRVTAIGTGAYAGTVTATHSKPTITQTSNASLNVAFGPRVFVTSSDVDDASSFRSVFEDSSFTPFEEEDSLDLMQEYFANLK